MFLPEADDPQVEDFLPADVGSSTEQDADISACEDLTPPEQRPKRANNAQAAARAQPARVKAKAAPRALPRAPEVLPPYGDAFMEVFSPPRIAPAVQSRGLRAKYSLNLPEWDADTVFGERYVKALLAKQQPYLLTLSPECRMYSILQRNSNIGRMDPVSVAEQQATADKHMGLCAELMLLQAAGQRKFLLEQPSSASSWQLPVIQDVMRRVPDVFLISFPQCRFGLRDPQGRPLLKRTKFLTNMRSIVRRFAGVQCICSMLGEEHGRIEGTIDGHRVSRWAQVYPQELVDAVADCVARDLR